MHSENCSHLQHTGKQLEHFWGCQNILLRRLRLMKTQLMIVFRRCYLNGWSSWILQHGRLWLMLWRALIKLEPRKWENIVWMFRINYFITVPVLCSQGSNWWQFPNAGVWWLVRMRNIHNGYKFPMILYLRDSDIRFVLNKPASLGCGHWCSEGRCAIDFGKTRRSSFVIRWAWFEPRWSRLCDFIVILIQYCISSQAGGGVGVSGSTGSINSSAYHICLIHLPLASWTI